MMLPCKHILAVRQLPQFDESLCYQRWKLSYFIQNHRMYQCNDTENDTEQAMAVDDTAHVTPVTQTTMEQQASVLTEHQKYRKAFTVAQDIAQKLATKGMNDFEEGMTDLMFLHEMWSRGKRVRIMEMETETGFIMGMYTYN